MKEEIRALSWKQPYASLMLHGKIETRTWNTKYRGLVLICVSKQPYSQKEVNKISGGPGWSNVLDVNWDALKSFCGKAIAIGELYKTQPMSPGDEYGTFVNYSPGLYCHHYRNVRAIEPFPWKGTQGWKTLDEETKQKIKFKG